MSLSGGRKRPRDEDESMDSSVDRENTDIDTSQEVSFNKTTESIELEKSMEVSVEVEPEQLNDQSSQSISVLNSSARPDSFESDSEIEDRSLLEPELSWDHSKEPFFASALGNTSTPAKVTSSSPQFKQVDASLGMKSKTKPAFNLDLSELQEAHSPLRCGKPINILEISQPESEEDVNGEREKHGEEPLYSCVIEVLCACGRIFETRTDNCLSICEKCVEIGAPSNSDRARLVISSIQQPSESDDESCSSKSSIDPYKDSNASDEENLSDGHSEYSLDYEFDSASESDFAISSNFSQRDHMVHSSLDLTLDEGVLKLAKLYLKHNCSKNMLKDILTTTCAFLPPSHKMPQSLFKFFKYLEPFTPQTAVTQHYYCIDCQMYLGVEVGCNHVCDVCQGTKVGVYYELDVCDVVRNYFECRDLATIMDNYPLPVQVANTVSDISHGSAYKNINLNRGRYDLNFALFTDGVKLLKSSVDSVWLLMVMPIEVPLVFRKSFISVVGVWCDNQEPNMQTFLRPFCKKFNDMHQNGVLCKNTSTNEEFVCKVKAPLMIADAPARAKVQNILNFNGKYGCNTCEIRAVRSAPVPGKKRKRVFAENHDAPLRNHRRMQEQGNEAVMTNSIILGIKGPSIMSTVSYIDTSNMLLPEYMHSVLLGVVKHLTQLWFLQPGPGNISEHIPDINNDLSAIRTPDFIHRKPRTLKSVKDWKASEFLYFLLFYSVPILKPYMHDDYFQHYLLLVFSMYILLQESITEQEIAQAEYLLFLFVNEFKHLYSDREMRYCTHQLVHLGLAVRRWGPLCLTSAFPFEDINGMIAKSTHGTKNVSAEIVKNIQLAQAIHILQGKVLTYVSAINSNDTSPIGKSVDLTLSNMQRQVLLNAGIGQSKSFYSRARCGKDIFTSTLYKQSTLKSANYHVSFPDAGGKTAYGSICFFLEERNEIWVFIQKYTLDLVNSLFHFRTRVSVKNILPYVMSDDFRVIKLNQLVKKEVVVTNYICRRPYNYNLLL